MTTLRVFQPSSKATKSKVGAAYTSHNTFKRLLGTKMRTEEIALAVREGFPVLIIERLQGELDVSQKELLRLAHLSAATLTRRRGVAINTSQRKAGGAPKLSPAESGRIYRIAAVLDDAILLFEGNREKAVRWLKTPAKALNGVAPLNYLDTEAGADAVRDLIGRIEHGVVA